MFADELWKTSSHAFTLSQLDAVRADATFPQGFQEANCGQAKPQEMHCPGRQTM